VVDEVRARLAVVADPEKASAMQSYMKSAMPFLGVSAVPLRTICQDVFSAFRLADRANWESAVLTLWDDARYREERYAALHLAAHRFYRQHQDVATLSLYRHLVVTGAWWDYVDVVASRSVGPILLDDHDHVVPLIREWASDDYMWVRRTAILCQLKAKKDTDPLLLRDVIEANVEGTKFGGEFFIRKAIGWALREYAKTDAAWVIDTVLDLGDKLSPLSRREALKGRAAPA
jgi:3-methyladenine DNA glycosylase AlkD